MSTTPYSVKYHEKFLHIGTAEATLRMPSYEVDITQQPEIDRCNVLAEEMTDLLYIDRPAGLIAGNTIGYGLSARQLKSLDGKESPRLSVVLFSAVEAKNRHRANKETVDGLELWMVNPVILRCARPWQYKQEGCLSFPNLYHNTQRWLIATVGFIDLKTLAPREIEFYGTEAVVMQHEIDHHDGKLFIDHALVPAVAPPKIGPNEACPMCLEHGKTLKWKRCLEHNNPEMSA